MEGIYWNDPIALIEESFLITVVSALLGVVYYWTMDLTHAGILFQFVCSVIMSVFVMVYPFIVLYILYKNIDKIRHKSAGTDTYSNLWTELNIPKKSSIFYKFNSGYGPVIYQFYSLLRRLLLPMATVFLIN